MVVTFRTARFDLLTETPNPINPLAGQSVLLWLREEIVKSGYFVTEPETEDWGWYIDVRGAGTSYMVGASADATDPTPPIDWSIQVHKHRSLKEKMLGRNKLGADDPLCNLIDRLVRADASLDDVEVAFEK